MTQYDAVIEAMRQNGGSATLGWLYQNTLKIPGVSWGTKTPFKSINRIVQDQRFFFRIRPGLWALNEFRNKFVVEKKTPQAEQFNHTFYQGLIVELGNLRRQITYIPPQDCRKKFINKPLGDAATLKKILPFSYNQIVRKASTVDVIWFNERKMPESFFEVEHTTNFDNSLLKFLDFQDFNAELCIVAPLVREREFRNKLSRSAYISIAKRVVFRSYELLTDMHTKQHAMNAIESQWELKRT
ncbi:MAG: hypothetical protein ACOZB3_09175 [Calditrichota bacterium]